MMLEGGDIEAAEQDISVAPEASSRMRSGRPKASVWEHFDDLGRDHRSHRHVARCKYCQDQWPSARVSQLKNHVLSGCKNIDAVTRAHFLEMETAMSALESMSAKAKAFEEGRLGEDGEAKSSHKRKLDSSAQSSGNADDVHTLLLRWLVHSGLPFETLENPFFQKALRILNSSYLCPSSIMLSSLLLDREHRLLLTHLTHQLSMEDCFSLGLDGILSADSTYILTARIILRDRRTIFWKAVEIPVTDTLPSDLVDRVSGLIHELGREKVLCLLSSRAMYLVAACRATCQRFEGLLHSICFLHALDDLVTSCLAVPPMDRVVCQAQQLASFFSSPHLLPLLTTAASSLQLAGKPVCVDVCDAASILQCLSSIKHLEKAFRKLAATSRDKLSAEILAILDSVDFWNLLTVLLSLLSPFQLASRSALCVDTTVASMLVQWISLTGHVERCLVDLPDSLRAVAFQTMNAITTDLSSTASRLCLFLDPRRRAGAVREDGLKSVLKLATEMMKNRKYSEEDCRAFCNQWFAYKDNAAPYCEVSPAAGGGGGGTAKGWWTNFLGKTTASHLAALGVLVTSLPAQLMGREGCGREMDVLGRLREEREVVGHGVAGGRYLDRQQTIRSYLEILEERVEAVPARVRGGGGVLAVDEELKVSLSKRAGLGLGLDKKALAAAMAKGLDRLAGVSYDHEVFVESGPGGEALGSHAKRPSVRDDFSVEDLIMEFDT